jgi:hypothetical protein
MGLFEQNDIVGDAVHLLEPYIGQGTQVDMEDAGTMALLVKTLCVNEPLEGCFCSTISNGSIDLQMESMFNILMGMGKCNKSEPAILVKKVSSTKNCVFLLHETFPDILLGASHNSYEDDEQRLWEE